MQPLQSRFDALLYNVRFSKDCRQKTIRNSFRVTIAKRTHLFPFRTQQLSSSTAEVVAPQGAARKASCPVQILRPPKGGLFLFPIVRF